MTRNGIDDGIGMAWHVLLVLERFGGSGFLVRRFLFAFLGGWMVGFLCLFRGSAWRCEGLGGRGDGNCNRSEEMGGEGRWE